MVKEAMVGVVCIVLGLMLLSSGLFVYRLVVMPNTIEYNGVRVSYYFIEEGAYRVFVEVFVLNNRVDLLKDGNSVDIAVVRWAKIKGWNVNRTQFSFVYLPVFLFGKYGSRRLIGTHADGGYCFGAIIDFDDTTTYRITGGDLMELVEWGSQGAIRIGEINIDFDLTTIVTTPPIPESFRESESKLFSADEGPLLKHTEINIEVPGKAVKAIRNLTWAGAALIIVGIVFLIYSLIKK
ncbi:MAG: hypothetical protein QXD45_02185 [Candidatus Bathyarchaeia archaeon]